MTVKEMMLIHKYLLEVRDDKEEHLRFASNKDIEIILKKMYPYKDVPEERRKIVEETKREIAEIDYLIETILKETMSAKVLATDTQVYLR